MAAQDASYLRFILVIAYVVFWLLRIVITNVLIGTSDGNTHEMQAMMDRLAQST